MEPGITTVVAQNITEDFSRSIYAIIPATIFGLLTSLIAIVGNMAVLIVCFWDEPLRSQVSSLLIVNLALADLVTITFTTIPSTLSIAFDRWPFGYVFCVVQGQLYHTAVLSSILSLTMVSIERAVAVFKPLHYHQYVNRKRIVIGMIYSWVQPTIVMAIVTLHFKLRYIKKEIICSYNTNEFYKRPWIIIPPVCTNLFVNTGIIIVLNVMIVRSATKSKKPKASVRKIQPVKNEKSKTISKTKQSNKEADNNLKIVLSIILIVIVYIVCIIPFVLIKIVPVFFPKIIVHEVICLFSVLFQYLSSAINPFIYGILRKDFRAAFKKLVMYFKRMF